MRQQVAALQERLTTIDKQLIESASSDVPMLTLARAIVLLDRHHRQLAGLGNELWKHSSLAQLVARLRAVNSAQAEKVQPVDPEGASA